MNSVVNFLAMLSADESNSHVKRMLLVCAEFERISKVALDKVEREFRGRGKRKQAGKDNDPDLDKSIEQQQIETQAPYRRPVMTPSLRAGSVSTSPISARNELPDPRSPDGQGYVQNMRQFSTPNNATNGVNVNNGVSPGPPLFGDLGTSLGPSMFGDGGQAQYSPSGMQQDAFNLADYQNVNGDMGLGGSFQQPFVPQDLWNMPMTLEWDWANVDSMGMGAFGFDETQLQNAGQQNQ